MDDKTASASGNVVNHPELGKVFVKIVKLNPSEIEYEISKHTLNEGSILESIDHPSIIKPHSHHLEGSTMTLTLPYMAGGDLFDWLLGHPFPKEDDVRVIARQVSSALCYLHSIGWCHRDVKPENVLLGESIKDLRLCDFGLAERCTDLLDVYGGSFEYAAPEVLACKPYDGKKADCWSFGVMLYILSQNVYPFGHVSKTQVEECIERTTHLRFIPSTSKELKDVIVSLLDKTPSKRMNMEDIYSTKFLTGHSY